MCNTAGVKHYGELTLFYFTGRIIGTYVLQVTICQASIVQMVIIYRTLRKRGVANLTEHLTLTHRVMMRMFGRVLTGIKKAGYHVHNLVIISLVFINPNATYCIVLRNLNVANCRLLKASYCEHFLDDNSNCLAIIP